MASLTLAIVASIAMGASDWDRGVPAGAAVDLRPSPDRRGRPHPPEWLVEWQTPTSTAVVTGTAAYYGDGIMDRVAANRGADLSGYLGGVAMMRAGDLGREVWLQVEGRSSWSGPYLAIDCAQRRHYRDLAAVGRVVDLGRRAWLALELPERPVPVVVRFGP